MIDASGDVAAGLSALHDIGSTDHIRHMPLLVLLNKADQPNAAAEARSRRTQRTTDWSQVPLDTEFLGGRPHVVAAVSMHDPAGLTAALDRFAALYLALLAAQAT